MSRWSTRFRRAAAVLVGVHLLQVILLAASAVCDLSFGKAAGHTATVAAIAAEHHPEHHGEQSGAHHAPASESAQTAPQHAPHHTSHTTSCPMAMACAATAIVVPVPALASHEVRVSAERIGYEAHMLYSTYQPPEPPPPRG